MISAEHVRTMARYNRWQNGSLYGAAATLTDADRRVERGAFWGSIHGTLAHLMWGDSIWMSRLSDVAKPTVGMTDSPRFIEDWADLAAARSALDEVIVRWADGVSQQALDGDLVWFSGGLGREVRSPRWLVVTHVFNHQTHHRGQAHAMLTAAGATPDSTDLIFMER